MAVAWARAATDNLGVHVKYRFPPSRGRKFMPTCRGHAVIFWYEFPNDLTVYIVFGDGTENLRFGTERVWNGKQRDFRICCIICSVCSVHCMNDYDINSQTILTFSVGTENFRFGTERVWNGKQRYFRTCCLICSVCSVRGTENGMADSDINYQLILHFRFVRTVRDLKFYLGNRTERTEPLDSLGRLTCF